ncbi:MAG: hypothetical protein IJR85_04760 [Synergistaceae bacterium]|nr:hypothetical protein [Synergistaceae bacterium]
MSLALSDTHTGIDYWENLPVCELRDWVSLIEAHYKQLERELRKRR